MFDSPDNIKELFHLSHKEQAAADRDGDESLSGKLARTKRSNSVDSFYTDKFESNPSVIAKFKNPISLAEQYRLRPKTNRRQSTPAALPSITKQLAASSKTNQRHNVQSNSLIFLGFYFAIR